MNWIECSLWLHLSATAAMFGLIWFVQFVHYPLLRHVGEADFPSYAARHIRQTTWVVGPLMLCEVATALHLLAAGVGTLGPWPWVGIGLLSLIWISTAVLQVPCHGKLEKSKDLAAIDRLVATNWVRTWAWTLRVPVAVVLLREFGSSAVGT